MSPASLAVRSPVRLRPDATRVVTKLFVAGNELWGDESRAAGVVDRILALDDRTVEAELADLVDRFGSRHWDLTETFAGHARRIQDRMTLDPGLSADRRLLLGAAFTHEYSVEAAALCNPSIVALPDDGDGPPGCLRFAMSVRGIGEGHLSSIGFRTGEVDADGTVTVDEPGPYPTVGEVSAALLDRDLFHGRLGELGDEGDAVSYVLARLDHHFTHEQLAERLADLLGQRDTRRSADDTVRRMRAVANCSYMVTFPEHTELSERVLWPAMAAEANGMEDARLVRFVEDDGTVRYLATYTAYDGTGITEQLLETTDFATFLASPVVGPAAANKGLALFPRRIGGQFVALSRFDAESNSVAFSDNPRHWGTATILQEPRRAWEVLQLGNCGPPIETADGWLVLTHGVGPMRTYRIGALLLDLDDPTKVIGQLDEPLLAPTADEQDGYVPNVVYSCGGLLHGQTLVIPYGIADSSIGFATVHWPDLRDALFSGL